jgi:outer membrane protein, multidrug efflux system
VKPQTTLGLLGVAGLLGACAGLPDAAPEPPAPGVAAAWQAPLPHAGQPTDLVQWWSGFDDPVLVQVVDAAQVASPNLASAQARIEQARATRISAGAALGPKLDGEAGAARRRISPIALTETNLNADLRASWEIDLFGANRAGRDAAQARLEGAQAAWHDARVSIAAEAATSYTELRACEAQRELTDIDAASRAETDRLTALSERAGFESPANAALARASAAQGRALATAQRARCDTLVKSLVQLTALDEPALRGMLATRSARLPAPTPIAPAQVPAALIAQRPDLHELARAVGAAAADQNVAAAQQLPRVTLNGSIGVLRLSTGAGTNSGSTWAVGPLQVTFPVFDGGARAADTDAARAAFGEAVALYQARVRTAVREVEDALVALASTGAQQTDAAVAAEGFEYSFRATEARFKGGLASLFELEDARRTAVAANGALIDLRRERVAAWISLYRALGGGWTVADLAGPGAAGAPLALRPDESTKALR